MPKKVRKKIGDLPKGSKKRRKAVSEVEVNGVETSNLVDGLGAVDVVDDVEVICCDTEAEFSQYLENRKVEQDIFVVQPDLVENEDRKYMHLLVGGTASEIVGGTGKEKEIQETEREISCLVGNEAQFNSALESINESSVVKDIWIVHCPKEIVGNEDFSAVGASVECAEEKCEESCEPSEIVGEGAGYVFSEKGSSAVARDFVGSVEGLCVAGFETLVSVCEGAGNISNVNEPIQSIDQAKPNLKNVKKICSAKDCDSSGTSFHSFPLLIKNGKIDDHNLQRCFLWVQRSGNVELLEKPTASLYRQNYLCSKHFAGEDLSVGHRLLPGAVPKSNVNTDLNEDFMKAFPVYSAKHSEIVLNQVDDDVNCGVDGNNNSIDKLQKNFEEAMKNLEWRICPVCKEKFFCNKEYSKRCVHSKPYCLSLSEENSMDPGDVPEVLKDLSYTEEQLIAQVRPIVVIVKLKGHQLGYKGNVINFHQDVHSFAKHLPHKINDLTNILTIRGSKGLKPVDFHVRADKVRAALEWLIENNKYYFDVTISEENLSSLPEDGNVFDELSGIDLPEEVDSACSKLSGDEEEEDTEQIFESGNPIMRPPTDQDQLSSIIDWPQIGKTAIDEFKTEGYVAKAFPTLFPYGVADLRTPRPKTVQATNYFKHLMRYKDGRFAQHSRFRYFALNSVMRWSALKEGNIFIQANEDLQNMTLGNLKEELKRNPSLAKKLMFKKTNIQGTRSYWFQRGKELLEMIEQIGLPTLFFTLSAADLHWPDLFKLLAPHEDFDTMSSNRKSQLIKANPLTVDEFFLKRVETFFKEVLEKKYKIKDHWFRIEYQHRGSPHVHGVLWIDGAPDVTNLTTMTEEERQEIANYFADLVTAFHPNAQQPKPAKHPCQKFLSEIEDLDQDLAEILNRVQMHACSPDHCMRVNKKTKKLECRFHFPQLPVVGQAQIVIEDGVPEFKPERNEENLNKYNRYFIQTWRANIDVAPVISKRALVNYLAKYISKSEKKSNQLADLMHTLNEIPNEQTQAKSVIRSLYLKACAERDFSAQEACHLLMGFKLVSSGGRPFQSIYFENNSMWRILNDGRNCMSLIEKYKERGAGPLHSMCLWQVAKTYSFKEKKFYSSNKQAIVQVFPKYKLRKEADDGNEKYYRQQILLYVPWEDESELKSPQQTWKEIYDLNLETIQKNSGQECYFENFQPDEEEFEEIEKEPEHLPPDEYMIVSKMGPSQALTKVDLGHRDVDLSADWHKSCSDYDKYGGIPSLLSFVSRMKAAYVPSRREFNVADVSYTDEQKVILDLVESQIESAIQDNTITSMARKVIVQGKAGTGKSLLISAITQKLQAAFGDGSYLLMGFTGISAVNINGATIHSTLQINPIEFSDMNGAALAEFKRKLQNVKFVIIDEYSTVGCELLHKIDCRLRQAMDAPSDDFGGLFVYLFGDINQLPPVGDAAPYSSRQKSMEGISGKILYDNFDAVYSLHQIQRQKDVNFQNVLNNVSSGNISKTDYDILKSRFSTNISPEERRTFKDAIRLFPLNEQVEKHNQETLNNLIDPQTGFKQPIAKIVPKVKQTRGKSTINVAPSSKDKNLYLAKGCKIMLRKNLWTDQGLANGAVGEVVDILYHADSTPQDDPPAVVICRFPNYKGPYLDDDLKTVPIGPTTVTSEAENGDKLSVSQFPLSLSYACTIHKSQGLTMDKVVVSLGDAERQAGLSYVALSRVKSLSGLMLEPFIFRRCERINNSKVLKLRKAWLHTMTTK